MSLQKLRQQYKPGLPAVLTDIKNVSLVKENISSDEEIKSYFPHIFSQPLLKGKKEGSRTPKKLRVGVVFSGGQAPGGHNVISGLFDALRTLHPESRLFGFLGGPSGIINGKSVEITEESLKPFRNQGGFDFLGSGRTKIETEEQFQSSLTVMQKLELDGLIIIGGDDSNTNAALLAEYFLNKGCKTCVIGVPKTIDGDLQSPYTAISFGFDTACKVYSELISNIARDGLSAKKYTHFIKLMGRSASHITLECALSTQPNLALIGEEIAAKKKTLKSLITEIADLITKRSEQGKDYGIILVPEGIIEFIPEIGALIKELNVLGTLTLDAVLSKLTAPSLECFKTLPANIQKQLLLERDPHGNIQLSLIETERLLIEKVSEELATRKKTGSFKGKFSPQSHFFGYEGRSAFPSNFDCNYCYALGMTSALLIDEGATGYMAFITNLSQPFTKWQIGALPLPTLIHLETRKGNKKPVIKKTLVDLNGKPFQTFDKNRNQWALGEEYLFPGPIQFYGDTAITETYPHILGENDDSKRTSSNSNLI